MILEVRPVFQNGGVPLTDQIIHLTNTLYSLAGKTTTERRFILRQVAATRRRGSQPIPMLTGNKIDEIFKDLVLDAIKRGAYPWTSTSHRKALMVRTCGWDV